MFSTPFFLGVISVMQEEKEIKKIKVVNKNTNGSAGAIYGFGFLGALVYFIQDASSFTDGLLGFLKALAWPALLVYKTLELLKF